LLEETKDESRVIAKKLLINGQQELVHHRDSIAPIDFGNQTGKEGDSTLLKIPLNDGNQLQNNLNDRNDILIIITIKADTIMIIVCIKSIQITAVKRPKLKLFSLPPTRDL
jgi:hypothetical protein